MTLRSGSFTVLAAAAIAAAGCGSSNNSNNAVSIDKACSDLAQARCSLRSGCSLPEGDTGLGFNLIETYGDQATCLAREALACTNGLSAPNTGNNPTLVDTMCVVAFASYTCTDFFNNLPPTACTPTGPAASGATCTFNAQCASGFCNGTKNSACGTCGTAPATGDDCSTSTCTRGDRCLGATSTCAAVVTSNGICDDTHPCDRGLSCVGVDAKTSTTGTCETAGTREGVPCGKVAGADGGSSTMPGCDPTRGLYCGGPSGSKTCMRVTYPGTTVPTPAGTACGQLADGSRAGCAAGTCYTATGVASGSDMGTCLPFAADGADCDTAVGPACMSPARCVVTSGTAGTCIVPTASMCLGT